MPKHKWKFKSYFRREAYGWKGTALASKRMKEAVSEIKKTAKKDSALAGEGTIELFIRLYPALMHIDGSSGALGTAMNKTIDNLMPILIKADWDMNTRGKWLDKLYVAIQDDGWGTFDGLRDCWGELCVYPGLSHIWADQLIPTVKEVFTSASYSYFVGTDMCLSCFVYTERYDELYELLQLRGKTFWLYDKFWAMALVKQGKPEEALSYAEQISMNDPTNNEQYEIDSFCESVLIDMGRIEEAYKKYGLKIPSYGTYLNIYRAICKKYPTIDKRSLLLDCIKKTGDKGKWFASAKNAGFLDIALDCAQSSSSNPDTLLRASRDFAQKDLQFSFNVGIQGIIRLMTETFYEPVTATDIARAYQDIEKIAIDNSRLEEFKAQLGREVLKQSRWCKPHLRETVLRRIGNDR